MQLTCSLEEPGPWQFALKTVFMLCAFKLVWEEGSDPLQISGNYKVTQSKIKSAFLKKNYEP